MFENVQSPVRPPPAARSWSCCAEGRKSAGEISEQFGTSGATISTIFPF